MHVKYALLTAGIYSPVLVAKPETTVISEALYKGCGAAPSAKGLRNARHALLWGREL